MADGGKVIIKIDGDTKGFEESEKKIESIAQSTANKISGEYTKAGKSKSDTMKKACDEVKKDSDEESQAVTQDIKKIDEQSEKTSKEVQDDFKKAFDSVKTDSSTAVQAVKVGFAAVGAGIVAAGAAIGKIDSEAVKAYSNYEQLVGGVDTLFGVGDKSLQQFADDCGFAADEIKDVYEEMANAPNKVLKNAKKAYQTAGLSANQYMETTIGFSASLLQSLAGDTVKAADYADQAIIDMSDNVNKMGTNMEMVQYAYQGFSKQNFMMLDNLALGYKGTKEEMERLLADAEKISGIKYDISSFADITQAIHVIQTEMGITGTTAEEAATTIQGSLNMTKASLKNLMTGLADPDADIGELLGQFIDSVETFGENLIPAVERVLQKLPEAIADLGSKLAEELPGILDRVLPIFVEGISNLVVAVAQTLPMLTESIVSALPQVLEAVQEIFFGIIEALPGMMETICTILPELIPQLVTGIVNMLVGLVALLPDIMQPLIDSFPAIVQSIVDTLVDNLPILIQGITELIIAIITILPEIWAAEFKAIPIIIKGIVDALIASIPELLQGIAEICDAVIQKIAEYLGMDSEIVPSISETFTAAWEAVKAIWEQAAPFFSVIWESIKAVFSVAKEVLGGFFSMAWTAIKAVWNVVGAYFASVWNTISGIFSVVASVLSGDFSGAWTAIKGIVGTWVGYFKTIWNGIKNVFASVGSWFKSVFTTAVNGIKSAWGSVTSFFSSIWEKIKAVFKPSAFVEIGKNLLMGLWNGINDKVQWLKNKVAGVVNKIKSWFTGKDGFDTHSPSKWSKQVFSYVIDGAVEGIEENKSRLFSAVKSLVEDTRSEVEKVQDSLQPVKILPSELVYAEETQRINNDESKTPERIAYEEEQTRQKYDDSKTWEELFYEQEQEHFKYDNVATQERVDYEAFKKRYDEMESKDKEKYKADLEALKEAAEKADKQQERDQEKYLKGLKEDADKAKNLKKRKDDEYLASLKDKADKADKIREDDNKKYLDGLKETAEAERKLFDARQKDIENAQKTIYTAMQSFADKAKATLEEVVKAQSTMAKKLKDYGELYVTDTFNLGNLEYEVVGLANLESQTKTLQEYAEKLTAVKERGEIPEELFGILRDLSVDEGIKFADALLNADDEAFNKYLQDWQNKQNAADNLSKVLYDDDAKAAWAKITDDETGYAAEFVNIYKENYDELCRKSIENAEILGETWTDTFTQGVIDGMNEALRMIKGSFASFVGIPQYAMAGGEPGEGGSTVINNYNITAKDESAKGQMDAIYREQDYRDMK